MDLCWAKAVQRHELFYFGVPFGAVRIDDFKVSLRQPGWPDQ